MNAHTIVFLVHLLENIQLIDETVYLLANQLFRPKTALKDEVAEEIFIYPNHNQRVIIKAYNNVKKDTRLIEEAIKHYRRFKGKNSG